MALAFRTAAGIGALARQAAPARSALQCPNSPWGLCRNRVVKPSALRSRIFASRPRTISASASSGTGTSTETKGEPMSGNEDRVSSLPSSLPTYKIKLLFDGECPLCIKEVNFLRAKSLSISKSDPPLAFVDIASPSYKPSENSHISYQVAMERIHGITPEGKVLVGVPVFRAAYEAVGLGWIYAITSLPVFGPIVDRVYAIWAAKRLSLTGRPELAEIMKARAETAGKRQCAPVDEQ